MRSMCARPRESLPARLSLSTFPVWINLPYFGRWFIADIIVNFRTGFMSDGHFVRDDWKAVVHYAKGSFVLDFLGSFPPNVQF